MYTIYLCSNGVTACMCVAGGIIGTIATVFGVLTVIIGIIGLIMGAVELIKTLR